MKYTLDTNIYIGAFRDPVARVALARFESAYTPTLYLTSVVAQELRAGARTPDAISRLMKTILAPFQSWGRVVAPSYKRWMESGAIRATLAARGRTEMTASFLNDILLAVTCREHGLVLVTHNVADFTTIRAVLSGFEFVPPYRSPL